jgi:hypothetical protein
MVRSIPHSATAASCRRGSTETSSSAALYFGGGPFASLQNGKIVVSGQTHDGLALFARFTADGRIDETFGKQGYAKVNRPAAGKLVAARNGKIVFVSTDSSDGLGLGTVYRLLSNGRLDTSFGPGKALELPGSVSTLALQPDQKILVGGGDGDMWTLARLMNGDNCAVPDVLGETVAKATAKLEKANCRRGLVSKVVSRTVPRGRVVSTYPPAGAHDVAGSPVLLDVSRGRH